MVAVPPDTPVTMPVALTLAVPALLHTPPGGEHVSIIVRPTHTLEGPTIADTVGKGLTVITEDDATLPQTLVMV